MMQRDYESLQRETKSHDVPTSEHTSYEEADDPRLEAGIDAFYDEEKDGMRVTWEKMWPNVAQRRKG